MKLFRITRKKYSSDLSGEGSRLFGGRWNNKGNAVLYTSEHASLAALEVLVQFSVRTIPSDLVLIELFSDNADPEIITPEELGRDWKSYPSPDFLKQTGDKWLQNMRSPLLKVPSVVISGEFNVLVNPRHSSFKHIKMANMKPFRFDQRIFD